MPFFPWKDDYSVGVEKLDKQHQQLVGLLNQLYEAMEAGKGREALKQVFDGLLRYTNEHFLTEESLMQLYGYPGVQEHRDKHEKMTRHVQDLVQQYEAGTLQHPVRITDFLKQWLARHIMETDKAYGPFFNGKGVH